MKLCREMISFTPKGKVLLAAMNFFFFKFHPRLALLTCVVIFFVMTIFSSATSCLNLNSDTFQQIGKPILQKFTVLKSLIANTYKKIRPFFIQNTHLKNYKIFSINFHSCLKQTLLLLLFVLIVNYHYSLPYGRFWRLCV